jgi:hypothetical protein
LSGYDLIRAFPSRWTTNLAGSTARPLSVPSRIDLRPIGQETVQIAGREHEIRALSASVRIQVAPSRTAGLTARHQLTLSRSRKTPPRRSCFCETAKLLDFAGRYT